MLSSRPQESNPSPFRVGTIAVTASLALGLFAGCGDGLTRVPITGLLTADGAPVGGAVVQFMPAAGSDSPGAIGQSGPDGKFVVVSSRNRDEGVPPGDYTVRVSKLVNPDGSPVPPDAPDADYPDCKEVVPRPFSGIASTLKVTIPKEGGEVKVNLPVKLLEYKRATKIGGG